ncbi:uncharacterized protein K452DRAFT_320165 [Aplosporella prunicola CBS 121167]|uniref:AAA+ ATPase domain-containing protein n=1 Tax=Aplosporella prunicola CBS 121167 TaxID=1176127 RepID=A0A6A6B805_9PEZI|nr:uncharacterized protein K452DRAFT_320165 [Aplosporella prunicola CBS 121167]KAF2139493.1 hypothetical protein K452DRAFT_320165 [Aplosporella prunicola CBS 121167]
MSAQDGSSARSSRLSKLFYSVTQGYRPFNNAGDAKLFFEAICDRNDHANCIERLVASPKGLECLRFGVRYDLSKDFINGPLANLLCYLSEPAIKQLCNGELLRQILSEMVGPPTMWNAIVQFHRKKALEHKADRAFAWLLLELLMMGEIGPHDTGDIAQEITNQRSFIDSSSQDIRTIGHRINHILLTQSANDIHDTDYSPGGRHDNDYADFRKIAIYPTEDELTSTEKPFYRRANAVDEIDLEHRAAVHLDNQFRLLREDMLAELRHDLQVAAEKSGKNRRAIRMRGLSLVGVDCGEDKRRLPLCLSVTCKSGLERLTKVPVSGRKDFLNDKYNRSFLKHGSLGCLIQGDHVTSFATLHRKPDKLSMDPPIVTLQFPEGAALEKALLAFKTSKDLQFMLVDTAMFACEPILKCLQSKKELPLAEELLAPGTEEALRISPLRPDEVIQKVEENEGHCLEEILNIGKSINLDTSQTESLLSGLAQTVSLIQGPPGTGKSFIGALLAKSLYDHTKQTILVICYTNHALDQFLEDLLDIGIPEHDMIRLGAKSSQKTKCLSLSEKARQKRRSQDTWRLIDKLKEGAQDSEVKLKSSLSSYLNKGIEKMAIMEYLEFSDDESHYFYAFLVPEAEDGMKKVGKGGKAIDPYYLYDRWTQGRDATPFKESVEKDHPYVWQMAKSARAEAVARWKLALLKEAVADIQGSTCTYNTQQRLLQDTLNGRDLEAIRGHRIVACTTTGAAMYTQQLQGASPGVVLVEEAGEILESHVLTALTSNTKQLILIGDHQQLRPKVSNYALTVERGDGYDLNKSLFERLILSGFPHTTLREQHRMHPEISSLVRRLTYPELLDAPSTKNRPPVRGLQNRVIFFNHQHPEDEMKGVADRRDQGSSVSRENLYEVEMVWKIVRYLGQQGYGTDKQVVLTPYLGQLHLLRKRLSVDNDPVLNDLDSYDLVKAGLLSPASAQQSKRPIKLSTIDNYQGEESEIIIASLTRSNRNGDIGFMSSPERLNVLLSRARDALILVGNAETFLASRKGKATWSPFLNHLNENGHFYDGLPVKCEQHPDVKAILKDKDDFDKHCPEGGCNAPCGTKLSCGIHDCPSRCHQLSDHSKMECNRIVTSTCPLNHNHSRRCHTKAPAVCPTCEAEARRKLEKAERDHKLDEQQQRKQQEYARQLSDVKDEIAHERRIRKDRLEQENRENILRQHRADLANLRAGSNQPQPKPEPTYPSSASPQTANKENNNAPVSPNKTNNCPKGGDENGQIKQQSQPIQSDAKDEWENQKQFEGAQNDALDELMKMIGLESVKDKFLAIKDKIDTAVRQNVDMKTERLGAALLGNPGTGKTTVARLYAKFLSSVGALPGSFMVETTGSRLANEGISGCKKHIEDILDNDGGVLFIDEAYQLVSQGNFGGSQVLDFLLAEVENLTGKVVFVLAGYQKQMEAFFAHNPGLPSRFPNEMQFADYNDKELLEITVYGINKKYQGRMKVEDGMRGLYARIFARRVGRGRGREGFGNARAIENALAKVTDRQARRLRNQRRAGTRPDDMILVREDLIGPEPSVALQGNESWSKLQTMIGLGSVKQAIKAFFDTIQYNYQRELAEKPLIEFSLNRVFLGSPGTGKTTVAKLYGQILADIGFLSSGQVVVKNPADFVGSALGESEKQTKGILASTVGKVLVIDEAYGLCTDSNDIYKTAVVDTLVAEVQSTPGEDRCVLLLGYKDEMEKMFNNSNPGLARRFPIDSAFVFEDFTDDEIRRVFEMKLKQQGFQVTDQGKNIALGMLSRARNRPNFGNAGEVDILLNKAKLRHQQRLSRGGPAVKVSASFEATDFDEDFDRTSRAATNINKLFEGVIGCEEIIAQLQGYQAIVANMRARDMDPREQIPFAFLFRGPPGTGKTTTARRMGKVYYDMGFLSNAEVIECSATELVGEYIGHTGPKTQKLLEKALGKVLFIDEAYRLAEGQFAKEAMDEIVDCLTKTKFAQKLVVILAGYDADINRLMSINPGLTSRFPETVVFRSMTPEECLKLFTQLLKRRLDVTVLEQPPNDLQKSVLAAFSHLSQLANWANARDVQTLTKAVFGKTISAASDPKKKLVVDENAIIEQLQKMIDERSHRERNAAAGPSFPSLPQAPLSAPNKQLQLRTKQDTNVSSGDANLNAEAPNGHDCEPQQPPVKPKQTTAQPQEPSTARDQGVSDAVWEQLQRDKEAAQAREREYAKMLEEEKRLQKSVADAKAEEEAATAEYVREIEEMVQLQRAKEAAEQEAIRKAIEEAKRRREEERLKREAERRAYEAMLAEVARKKKAEEEQRKKEAEVQKKLQDIGVCVMGFRWIKQSGGYRCAGGSHFVSDAQLGM